MTAPTLPVEAVLPALREALRDERRAVLVAPPGAGKTTAVAPALLSEPWCDGEVLVLAPRRVAARAAAERMAELRGERVGATIGYTTRLDSRPGSRVTVMTEAIFVARILADPDLPGVSAVLFDEVHERHLDSDLALALALESAAVLRDDLRLVAMSATLDGARYARLMGGAPVIESAGKAWPLTIRWLGARPDARLSEAMSSAVQTAWREEAEGDILAFLPGVGDIERTMTLLAQRLPNAVILPLHGQIEPAAQRTAIRSDPDGRRRIVLATSIAETSLTLDGVRIVVDAGLSRRAEFDTAAGLTRLVTHRASRASADQRAGRAARQGPGVCYRLWEEGGHLGRPPFEPPEILVSDLMPLALSLARWGAEPGDLGWVDPPPAPAMDAARSQLRALGALDAEGRITGHGKAMAALPLDPAAAHMLLFAARQGEADEAASLALLMQERGLGGRSEDLAVRYDRFRSESSPRAKAARALARSWARRAEALAPPDPPKHAASLPALLAEGFPDRIARRRDASGEAWISAGGRGFRLDPASPLAASEWTVIADAQGEAKGARILSGLALPYADITGYLAHRIETRHTVRWVVDAERAEPVRERRLGAILVSRGHDISADSGAVQGALFAHLERVGLGALPLAAKSAGLLRRAEFASLGALSPANLVAEADDWLLTAFSPDTTSLRDLDPGDLHEALLARLSWDERKALDRIAPSEFVSPAGTRHLIDYADPGGPSVEIRVQALFGLDRHPTFGEPARPLRLLLTSPGGKPIQTTLDLPGFWRGSWRDVCKDMKGRYPKHRWPDTPWTEDPSLKTKNAFSASRRD